MTSMEPKMKENNMKENNMKGGVFSKLAARLKGKYSFSDVVKNTKKSEGNLITAYEEMDSKAKKYNKAYIKHMENIKMLDDYVNFNGMETIFKKVIMKDNFVKGHIDKSNPLLFRNYIIEGDVLPSTFRREHIMSQIRYFMNKSFAGRDHAFIKHINVTEISKNDFVLNIVTIDNLKQTKVISHSNYLIDKEKTKKFISEILSSTKKKLKRTSLIAEFDNDKSGKSSSNGTHKTRTGKSHNSMEIFGKIDKSKNKTKKTSENMFKISNGKHTKSHTKKNTKSKSLVKEKMSNNMNDYEKHQRDEKRRADKIAEMQKKPEYPQKPGFEDKKGMILGGPQTGIAPLQGVPGQVPAYNPIKAKCEAYGENKEACEADGNNCRFAKYGKCAWKDPNYRPPQFGNPPPTLGLNPGPNAFAVPQQQQQALF